jgi:hypothetical protein
MLCVAGVSVVASLVFLVWAIVAYTRTLCQARPDKTHVSWPALVCQFTWRNSMVTARIAALVSFSVGFHGWLFILLGTVCLVYTKCIYFGKYLP